MSNIDFSQIVTADSITAKGKRQAIEAQIAADLSLLAETGWMVERKAETGKAIPKDVLADRQAARERISSGRAQLLGLERPAD